MVCAFFVKLSADASQEQRSLFNFTDTDSRSNLFTYQSCQRLVKVSLSIHVRSQCVFWLNSSRSFQSQVIWFSTCVLEQVRRRWLVLSRIEAARVWKQMSCSVVWFQDVCRARKATVMSMSTMRLVEWVCIRQRLIRMEKLSWSLLNFSSDRLYCGDRLTQNVRGINVVSSIVK